MQISQQCSWQTGTTWSYNMDPIGPLRPAQDTLCPQTDELKTLITKDEMGIICPKQVTTAIKHDTGCIIRIATEIEQTSEHHWYGVFMRYAPSANGILHLILHCCTFVLYFISFAGNTFLYLCLSNISLCWKNESPVVT